MEYVADFETILNDDDSVRVWLFMVSTVEEEPKIVTSGNNIEDFIKWSKTLYNPIIYLHNLKFDGEFILYYLETNDIHYSKEKVTGSYNCLISNSNQWYSVEYIIKKKGHHTRKITFRDSLKKIPFPVRLLPEKFGLEESKGQIDYKKKRSLNHKVTKKEYNYIKHDVIIVAKCLYQYINAGFKKITIGADALDFFIKQNYGTKRNFRFDFPVLPLEMDADIRQAYKGGFTYLKPEYKEKIIKNMIVYDVNSLYPDVMYHNVFPYDVPIFFKGKYKPEKKRPLYIQHIRCSFDLKKGYLPTIQLKHNLFFNPVEYVETTNGEVVDLILTSVDLELFFKHYEVDNLDYINGYAFKAKGNIFKDYIDHFMKMKVESKNEGERTIAKLFLNSLYGKFATNPNMTGKQPVYSNVYNRVMFIQGEEEIKDPIYTPLACFVTAYARKKTIETAQANYDRFVYADTDSLHLKGQTQPDILVDDKKLGYWKEESRPSLGKFIRSKTYIEKIDGKLNVKCAGMPEEVKKQVTIKNFKVGSVFTGKLRPDHVTGGINLVDTEFTIR